LAVNCAPVQGAFAADIIRLKQSREHLSQHYPRLFFVLVYPLSSGGISVGRKELKKTLAIVALMGLPAATLGMQGAQNAPQQETAPSTAGASTAKSHHSTHHKHSKNAHHKAHKHHTSKQHPQAQ